MWHETTTEQQLLIRNGSKIWKSGGYLQKLLFPEEAVRSHEEGAEVVMKCFAHIHSHTETTPNEAFSKPGAM